MCFQRFLARDLIERHIACGATHSVGGTYLQNYVVLCHIVSLLLMRLSCRRKLRLVFGAFDADCKDFQPNQFASKGFEILPYRTK